MSLLLILATVVSMVATLGISASAKADVKTVTVGQTSSFTIAGMDDQTPAEGNIKDIQSSDPESLIVSWSATAENELTIYAEGVKVAESVEVSYWKYSGSDWSEYKVYYTVEAASNTKDKFTDPENGINIAFTMPAVGTDVSDSAANVSAATADNGLNITEICYKNPYVGTYGEEVTTVTENTKYIISIVLTKENTYFDSEEEFYTVNVTGADYFCSYATVSDECTTYNDEDFTLLVVELTLNIGSPIHTAGEENCWCFNYDTYGKEATYTWSDSCNHNLLVGETLQSGMIFSPSNEEEPEKLYIDQAEIVPTSEDGYTLTKNHTIVKVVNDENAPALYLCSAHPTSGSGTCTTCGEAYSFAEAPSKNEFYLDLDDTTTDIKESKDIDQLYSATVKTNKADVTKVQVSWTIPVLSATVTQNKIWDTEALRWVDDTNNENTVTASDVTAVFDFVNLSSVKVNASVAFEAIENVDAAEKYTDNAETADAGDGKIVLDTANTDAATYDNTGKVQVKITADEDFFKALTESTAADTKYGKYIVTIGKATSATVCSSAESASVYVGSGYSGTHIYADEDTGYDGDLGAYCCVPCFCTYDNTTGKFVVSNSSGHTSNETEFEDVTAMGWYFFNGTKFVRCADDEIHPNNEELPTTNAEIVAITHSVTVSFYADGNDEEPTTITVLVSDGTKITVDGSTISIGCNSFTTAKEFDAWWAVPSMTLPATVTGDLDISPVTFGF